IILRELTSALSQAGRRFALAKTTRFRIPCKQRHGIGFLSHHGNRRMDTKTNTSAPAEANLGLWDAISIIVGIIIGVGIFETPHDIFQKVPHPAYAIGLWVLGGVLAFIGALCFAELASAYPRSGGEYVCLTRAFGPLTGFLFAWSQLSVIRSGSIASM